MDVLVKVVNTEDNFRDDWKESIIVPIYKKRDKTQSNDYRVMKTVHKIIAVIIRNRKRMKRRRCWKSTNVGL